MTAMKRHIIALMLLAVIGAVSHQHPCRAANGISPEWVKAKSGELYSLFAKNDFAMDFALQRPSQKRLNVVLSIPAAFTTHDNRVDGVYVHSGKIYRQDSINKDLGGAIVIKNGECKMFATASGSLLTPSLLQSVQQSNGSLFQQFLIVANSRPASFKDKSKFQRRAILEFCDGRFGIVESTTPITFSTFIADLVCLGVRNALYLDMGAWDEGWYRNSGTGKVKVIGNDRSLTYRQSNWIIFRMKTGADKTPPNWNELAEVRLKR